MSPKSVGKKNSALRPVKIGRRTRRGGYEHGQINQVFVYIMVVIVFGVVFLFGYRAINHFVTEGEKVAFITFQTDLEDAVKSIKNDFDDVVVYNAERPLRVPNKYTKLCFVDFDFSPMPSWIGTPQCPGRAIGSSAQRLGVAACDALSTFGNSADAEANVFLTPDGLVPIKTVTIKLRDENGEFVPFYCFEPRGRLDMRVLGRGTHTVISPLP
jgi:hypothetical protein